MASTNLLQWNPGEANQESDAQYANDVLRQGGFPQGSIVPGPTLNKVLYQLSTLAAALGVMLANKGLTTSDADLNVLAATLAHIRLDSDFTPPFKAYGYAPVTVVDLTAAETHEIALGGDTTIVIINVFPGQVRRLAFVQDNTGGHQVAFPVQPVPTGGGNMLGWSQPAPDPNSVSVQEYFVDGAGTLRAITPQSVT